MSVQPLLPCWEEEWSSFYDHLILYTPADWTWLNLCSYCCLCDQGRDEYQFAFRNRNCGCDWFTTQQESISYFSCFSDYSRVFGLYLPFHLSALLSDSYQEHHSKCCGYCLLPQSFLIRKRPVSLPLIPFSLKSKPKVAHCAMFYTLCNLLSGSW